MSDPFYHSQAWRRLAAECIRRQPICAIPGCGQPSRHADHVTPRRSGGADALWNLRGLCTEHHNARRGASEPTLHGCDVTGQPKDSRHWWNSGAA